MRRWATDNRTSRRKNNLSTIKAIGESSQLLVCCVEVVGELDAELDRGDSSINGRNSTSGDDVAETCISSMTPSVSS